MHISARRPWDDDFYRILKNIIPHLPTTHIFYYNHGGNDIDGNKDILFFKDSLTVIFSLDLTHYKTRQRIINEMESCNAKLWWIGTEPNAFNHPSIEVIWWGSEFMLQADQYLKLDDIDKSPNKNSNHWISLTLGPRHSRVYTAACLMHYGNLERGEMRIKTHLAQEFNTLSMLVKNGCYWPTPPDIKLEPTYKQLLSQPWWGSQFFRWNTYNKLGHCNNALNFDHYLRSLYSTTMVEVVNETSIADEETGNPAPVFITEKFANSVHALHFPIMCSSAGTVEFLESLGFDMFRDTVDHSYDIVTDPTMRIHQAIRDNAMLLNEYDTVYNLWNNNLPRLIANRDHLRNMLSTFTEINLNTVINKINNIL